VFASVTITLATDPASDPQDFVFTNTFQVSSPTNNTLDTDASSVTPTNSYSFGVASIDTGYLYVTVTEPSDWWLTDIQCTGDSDVSYNVDGQNVSLQPDSGESIACTFTMTKRAQLTLSKATNPSSDPQDFQFDLTGGAVPASWELDTDPGSMFTGSNITWSVEPDDLGDYTMTEGAVSGWTLTNIQCTGNTDSDQLTSLIDRVVEIGVDAGELIECTFTNTKDGFESTPPTDAPTGEPSIGTETDAPSDAPTDAPSDMPSTVSTPNPTQDEGGETDSASEPGTDTEGAANIAAGSNNIVLLIVALGALSAILLVTRPKRKRP
jgi:hypothetical protein